MKDYMAAVEKCKGILDKLNIPYDKHIVFSTNTRARARWGQCSLRYGMYSININKDLLSDDNDDKALETVILHELLHTVFGCMNHGPKWKSLAEKVNRSYGYHVSRTNGAEEMGVSNYRKIEREYKYVFQCTCCGQVVKRQKSSKFVQHYDLYRCGACNGKFVKVS